MTDLVIVVGARPNFMKAAPIVDAARRIGLSCTIVHTGQHYDDELSRVFFDELHLPAPGRVPGRRLGAPRGADGADHDGVRERAAPDRAVGGRRRRRRQLDPRLRPGRGEGGLSGRPRRGRPALLRAADARGDQPAADRPHLDLPVHDEPGRRREPPPARGSPRTRSSSSATR